MSPLTALWSSGGKVPIRSASLASIVAILAVRTTDAAGNPATARSDITTSPGQPRFSELVIIITHMSPCCSWMADVPTTKAGRRWRTGRSVQGNGTFTVSQASKLGIGPSIGFCIPFAERGEWIFPHFACAAGPVPLKRWHCPDCGASAPDKAAPRPRGRPSCSMCHSELAAVA